MTTVHEIIHSCGGPERIEAEANARGTKLTLWAVKKWMRNGIPEKHWALVTKLSGAGVGVIYAANNTLRASQTEAAE